jgi:hypothetical protein
MQPLGPARLRELLSAYLDGQSEALLQTLRELLPPLPRLPLFWQHTQAIDFETAQHFFNTGPKRNLQFKQQHALEGLLRPEELDDLCVGVPVRR